MADERSFSKWIVRDFVLSQRAKGKIDGPSGSTNGNFAKVCYRGEMDGTMERVFPHRAQEEKLQKQLAERASGQGAPRKDKTQRKEERKVLQQRCLEMQHELASERKERDTLMEELIGLTADKEYKQQRQQV